MPALVKTHRIPLTDEVIAQMRLGELIFADGSGGFLPDIVVPASQNPEEEDQALTAALELFRDFRPKEKIRDAAAGAGCTGAGKRLP
jgi:hypothetical protein